MSQTHEDKEVSLGTYELGYHLVPSLSENDLALRVGEIMQAVTKSGGKILSEGAPQAFTLAYTMKRLRGGRWDTYNTSHFGWIRFEAPTNGLEEVKELLEHADYLIRHLILRLEAGALASTAVTRAPKHVALKEVHTTPKQIEKKQMVEEKGEVSEEELDKQIEDLIK